MRSRIEAAPVRKTVSLPKEHDQHEYKCDRSNASANGDSRRGIGIAASLHAIPHFPDANKDKDERPILPENWSRLESGAPIAQQKEATDRNEDDRENERHSSGIAVLGHGTPPLSCTTHASGK